MHIEMVTGRGIYVYGGNLNMEYLIIEDNEVVNGDGRWYLN